MISDDGSSFNASRMRARRSTEIGFMKTVYQVFDLMERRCNRCTSRSHSLAARPRAHARAGLRAPTPRCLLAP
jgi:hypothetical protein